PRPAFWDGSGDVVRFELPADLVAEVDRVAREQRATRYMLLLAVYQALLGRYSGRSDIAVCTTLADRGRAEVASLIGPFVNTIVLRTDLSGGPSFTELLGRVRSGALRDFSHSEAPFDRVVGEVVTERDLSRHPLAQASFTLLNTVPSAARLDDLDVGLVRTPLTGTPLDVFLDLSLRANGDIAARLQYSTTLFDQSTMVRFTEGYLELLRAVTAAPQAPVAELAGRLEPLPGKERARLVEMAGAERPAPAPAPFGVAGEPNAVALVCGEKILRYRELDALGGGLATALRAAGVGPGTPVGVCMKRGIGSVASMTAIWRAGGVYVPLDPALPEERLRFMAEEAALACVLTDAATAELAGALGPRVLRVEDAEPDAGAPHHAPDPHDLAYIIFTSGSTGRPKAVGIEHGAIDAHVAAAREEFGITARDRVLAFSSFSFDASLDQLLTALGCGATLVVRPDEQWLPAQIPLVVERYGITVLNLPPTYWAELAFSLTDRTAASLAPLRLLVLGGESVPAAALAAWRARAPHVRVLNAYGPTETTVTATTHEVGAEGDPGRVPIGRPLGSRRVYVVDARDELVPVGEPGELLIGGPELARGYLGQPALTARKFVPDPYGEQGGRLYRTGDLVRRLPSGELEFLGRTDDQVKIRGFRIEPAEIAAVLEQHPDVHAATVLVRELRGERALVGYAAGRDGGPDAEALAAWCRTLLPGYMVPAAFVLLDALPRTVQGKVDTGALPDPQPAAPAASVAPRTPTEVVTAQIWAEVLGLPEVGIREDFFSLGGHSLRAVAAASRLRTAFDCPIQVRDLFDHPTVELLAIEVERQLIDQISSMSDDEIDLSLTSEF
ncbi:non-ribosomal peptide synthetase, partial [Streptomyces sp. NPDC001193]